MLTVQPATPEMFPAVHGLLQQFNANNPHITTADWRGLFEQPWRHPDDPLGFVLVDNHEIVGYLGTLCHRRIIRGRLEKICNITSWVTRPTHRQQSVMLLTPVLKLAGYTILNLTPAKHTHALFLKFGYRPLEHQRHILYPLPQLRTWFRRTGFSLTTDRKLISEKLRGTDAEIFRDHQNFRCGHLLLHRGDAHCHVIYTRSKGRKFHFAHVHHISDKNIFFANLNLVRLRLPLASRALFTMIDSRFVPAEVGTIPHSRLGAWSRPTLFKSATLEVADIDNLYTELIVLNL